MGLEETASPADSIDQALTKGRLVRLLPGRALGGRFIGLGEGQGGPGRD